MIIIRSGQGPARLASGGGSDFSTVLGCFFQKVKDMGLSFNERSEMISLKMDVRFAILLNMGEKMKQE